MAHCAEVNNQGTVVRVIVVDETYDVFDNNGNPITLNCEDWCKRTFGGNWLKTSYNSSFRKNYAGPGFTYDNIRDAFISPKPFASWKLNEKTCLWEPLIPCPIDGKNYYWDEQKLNWIIK